jgi:hypothetical protein
MANIALTLIPLTMRSWQTSACSGLILWRGTLVVATPRYGLVALCGQRQAWPLLWRMKAVTHREKDAGDLVFLRAWFAQRGEQPPKV